MNANELYKLQEKLSKYIKFLSSHFNVNVEFETPKCERKENTIYLPSLSSLSSAEANSLFGVLLLESGFLSSSEIKSEEALISLKTQLHANLSKIIEAARVENILKDKFGGAQEMLDDLWKNTLNEKNLKERFFPSQYWDNEWGAISYWVHEKITNSKKTDKEIYEEMRPLFSEDKIYKKAIKNLEAKKLSILPLLNTKNNKDTLSCIKTAEKIHEIHFANKKDPSPILDFKKVIAAKKKADAAALAMKKKIEEHKIAMAAQEANIAKIKAARQALMKSLQPQTMPLKQQITQLNKTLKNLNNFENFNLSKEMIENEINNHLQKIQSRTETIAEKKQNIQSLEERLNKSSQDELKLTKEEKENISQKLGLQPNASLEDLEKKLEELNNAKDSLQEATKDLKELKQLVKEEERLQSSYDKLKNNIDNKTNALDDLNQKIQDLNNKYLDKTDEKYLEKLNALMEKKKSLEQEILEKNELLKNLLNQKANNNNEIQNNSQNALKNLSQEELNQKIQELGEQISANKELAQLNNKMLKEHSLDDNKLQKLKDKIDNNNNKITNEQNQINKLENKINNLKNELKNLLSDQTPIKEVVSQLQKDFSKKEIEEFINDKLKNNADDSTKDKINQMMNQAMQQMQKNQNNQQEGQSGQSQEGQSGQPQEGQSGQPQEGQPGQSQEGQPGQSQEGQPGQSQESQSGQPQEGQPGQSQEGQLGQSQEGQLGQSQEGQSSSEGTDVSSRGNDSNLGGSFDRTNNNFDANNKMSPQSSNNSIPSTSKEVDLKKTFERIQEFLEKQLEAQSKLNDSLQKNLTKLNEPLEKLTNQVKKEEQEINSKNAQAVSEIMLNSGNLDKEFKNCDIDTQIYPFQELKGWDEANDLQKQFDAKATKQEQTPIVNGMNLAGNNPGQFLNQTMEQLEKAIEINVQELFGNNVVKTSLEEFGSSTKQFYDDMNKNVFGSSSKPHVAGTKKFDKTEKQTYCTENDKLKDFERIKIKYNPILQEVKKAMMQTMKFSKRPKFKGGKEEGDLDSRNIYKLATKQDDDYYEITQHKYVNKISASILIDISGSMDKDPDLSIEQAKAAAYLLSEGLKSVHIPHEIIGYGAQYNEEMKEMGFTEFYNRRNHNLLHIQYKTFEDKNNTGLANVEFSPIDNCDGESIETVYKKLKKRQEKTKMVFVISDLKPFLFNSDIDILDEDLKKVMRQITNDKNHIFVLGFDKGPEALMQERYFNLEDMKNLPKYIKNISFNEKTQEISIKRKI